MNHYEELGGQQRSRWLNVPAAAAATGLIAASIWSIRVGAADYRMRQETVGSAHAAIALTPDQSECYARLAWLASGSDPRTAKAALLHAVAVNPWDTRSRIELGLLAEAEGDSTTSERYLLQAAETDHLFLPRWTLANYYFRRGDTAQFWRWAKEAADRVYGDAQPVFRLCGRVAEDGKLIDRLQIQNRGCARRVLILLVGPKPRRFDRSRQYTACCRRTGRRMPRCFGRPASACWRRSVWTRPRKSGTGRRMREEPRPRTLRGRGATHRE